MRHAVAEHPSFRLLTAQAVAAKINAADADICRQPFIEIRRAIERIDPETATLLDRFLAACRTYFEALDGRTGGTDFEGTDADLMKRRDDARAALLERTTKLSRQ